MRKNDVKYIYEYTFGNDDNFFDRLFECANSCCKTYKKDGEIVSILFLLPVNLTNQNQTQKAVYLFAAATHPKHRNCGYMSKLINRIKGESKFPIILKPSNENLIEFYEKLEFRKFIAKHNGDNNFAIVPAEEFSCVFEKDELDGDFTAMIYGEADFNINGITFEYTME